MSAAMRALYAARSADDDTSPAACKDAPCGSALAFGKIPSPCKQKRAQGSPSPGADELGTPAARGKPTLDETPSGKQCPPTARRLSFAEEPATTIKYEPSASSESGEEPVATTAEDFMEMCLEGAGVVDDWYAGSDQEGDDAAGSKADSGAGVETFAMCDSDSEDAESVDLDDVYNFDHDRLADLLAAGATEQELIESAQEGMAIAFAQRLLDPQGEACPDWPDARAPEAGMAPMEVTIATPRVPPRLDDGLSDGPRRLRRLSGAAGPQRRARGLLGRALGDLGRPGRATARRGEAARGKSTAADEKADDEASNAIGVAEKADDGTIVRAAEPSEDHEEPELRVAGDISGLMTPPKGAAGPDAKDLADGVAEAFLAGARLSSVGRRSSVARRDSISSAVVRERERLRRSSVGAAGGDAQAARRARMSIEKVADVLEDAGVDSDTEEAVTEKFRLVQNAVAEASRRHRQSIVEAVKGAVEKQQQAEEEEQEEQVAAAAATEAATACDMEKQQTEEEKTACSSKVDVAPATTQAPPGFPKLPADVEEEAPMPSTAPPARAPKLCMNAAASEFRSKPAMRAAAAEFKPKPPMSASASSFTPGVVAWDSGISVQDRISMAVQTAYARVRQQRDCATAYTMQQQQQQQYSQQCDYTEAYACPHQQQYDCGGAYAGHQHQQQYDCMGAYPSHQQQQQYDAYSGAYDGQCGYTEAYEQCSYTGGYAGVCGVDICYQ